MDVTYYKKYEPFFGSWRITKTLGEGSFGKVFEIKREDFDEIYKSALKVITVPQSESELKSIMNNGMDDISATEYFRSVVKEIVSEFVLMSKLKGNSNVVSYEDHQVIQHEGKIGWDILIRMELLTSLPDYARDNALKHRDVIKLGIDICNALELCQKRNIIHRDIKPENIFVSEDGYYKLGDFGIARTIEKAGSGLSKKGTYTYMAPEIYKGGGYGSSVDIYSLGIVMYRLLNGNRAPFLPPYPEKISPSDMDASLIKRMSGEKFPAPAGAEGRLAEIILKACSYNPAERYSSPIQMRQELEAVNYESGEAKIIYPKGDVVSIPAEEKTVSMFGMFENNAEKDEPTLPPPPPPPPLPVPPQADDENKKEEMPTASGKIWLLISGIIMIAWGVNWCWLIVEDFFLGYYMTFFAINYVFRVSRVLFGITGIVGVVFRKNINAAKYLFYGGNTVFIFCIVSAAANGTLTNAGIRFVIIETALSLVFIPFLIGAFKNFRRD
ncbi:MAG: serine/threonine protein kinase [Clostridiales bacterium]|jgi:serine/threonine protein kinase|nr:serine/threonine protein kinase [Clostridiales bacterium]